jgi:hypothetical protein
MSIKKTENVFAAKALRDLQVDWLLDNPIRWTLKLWNRKMALHAIKYLDRLVENSKWAEINACNFCYIGQK